MPENKNRIQISNVSIDLKGITMGKIHLHPVTPIIADNDVAIYSPNVWTMCLYGIGIICASIFVLKFYRRSWQKRHKSRTETSNHTELQEINPKKMNPRQLPSEASF